MLKLIEFILWETSFKYDNYVCCFISTFFKKKNANGKVIKWWTTLKQTGRKLWPTWVEKKSYCISNKTPHIKCRLLLNYVRFCLKCRKLTFIYISPCSSWMSSCKLTVMGNRTEVPEMKSHWLQSNCTVTDSQAGCTTGGLCFDSVVVLFFFRLAFL